VPGCTDSTANNYNSLATDENGLCDYDLDNDGVNDIDEVLGCTDSTANNYNYLATDEDGLCDYDVDNDGVSDSDEVPGCTDSTANNYNSLATDEDGLCDYEESFESKEVLPGFGTLMTTSMLLLASMVRSRYLDVDTSHPKDKKP
jgi:hypothetical protein